MDLSGKLIAGLVSPYLCPPGSTGKIAALFETTSTDDNGNSVPTTGYEMICVDGGGTESPTPARFMRSFGWGY